MITKQRALFYQVGENFFRTLEEAQKHDIRLLVDAPTGLDSDWEPDCKDKLVDWIMKNATPLVDILTTTPTSRAKARKTNGAKRTKKPKLQPAKIEA